MPSFTEYVHLVADGNEAIAVINKINEAIAKMRREAASPINVKIRSESEQAANGERKIRNERKTANDAELEALKRKKQEIAAIQAMNKEQGNPSYAIRFGNQESLAQGQRFNEQLAETTRRINRIADAHKHVKNVAKDAGVEVSKSLAEKLSSQVANKSEKADVQAIRDAESAEKRRIASLVERQRQEEEGVRRINQMEKERLSIINERAKQEEEGHRRVFQMEEEERRAREKIQREERNRIRDQERAEQRARRERETELASYREGGIRGVIGEMHRDLRRNMIYGAIGQGEALIHKGYESDVARDTAIENVRQAGRTPAQISQMLANAQRLSLQNPTLTATELLTMQQHNIGAFGNFQQGIENSDLSARYLAIRKGKVGEEEALKENMSILKIGEESGRIRNPGFLQKLYNAQLQAAQAEGSQYDPNSLLTTMRMLKSSKFGLSDDAMMTLLPFMGMSEGAARTGNQIAMFSKSMTMAGKQIKASGVDYGTAIAGTSFSDGKGGYNPEMQTKFMAGDFPGVGIIVDQYLRQKGFNPEDKSTTNVNAEVQKIAKAIGNTSAREALLNIWENREQFEKQQRNAAQSQGMNVPALATRTLQGAQDAVVSQFDNMSSNVLKPLNPVMIRMMNGITVLEEYAAKNGAPSGSTLSGLSLGTGLGIAGIMAMFKGAYNNPQVTAQTALLTTIAANTGVSAAASVGNVSKDAAKLFGVNPLLLGGLAGVAIQQGVIQPWIDDIANKQQEANVNKYRNNGQLRFKSLEQIPGILASHDYNSGNRDDHRPTKGGYEQELRLAVEAQRRNDRDNIVSIVKHLAEEHKYAPPSSVFGRTPTGNGQPIIVPPQPFHKEWHMGSADSQGLFNSGGIVNNAGGSARDIATSTAKDAISKLNAAGSDAAGALSGVAGELKTGAQAAGSAIATSGGVIVSAIDAVASAIQGAAAKLGSIGGTPAVKPQATGPADRGNR